MPAIKAPMTTEAHTEVSGRIEVIANQIAEADRMVGYFTKQAMEQAQVVCDLRALHRSYVGLCEDAGLSLPPTP